MSSTYDVGNPDPVLGGTQIMHLDYFLFFKFFLKSSITPVIFNSYKLKREKNNNI
jgi:hypothetical protein